MRNIGDQVAYIKEISFDILDYYNMINPQMTHYQLVESSHTYDVVLGKEKQQVFNVSQSIGANEVDRFQVKLASSIAETRMVTIYYLTLSIIYDEDNKVVKSEKYLWAVPSISELLSTINQVKRHINPKLCIEGILITMVDARTNYAKDISNLIRNTYCNKITVFKTEILRFVRTAETSAEGKSIFAYDPLGKVAEAYESLTQEVLKYDQKRN